MSTETDQTVMDMISKCKDIVHNVNYKISQGKSVNVIFEKQDWGCGHEFFVAKQKDEYLDIIYPNEKHFVTIFEVKYERSTQRGLLMDVLKVGDFERSNMLLSSNEGARLHNELASYFRVMDKAKQEKQECDKAKRQKAIIDAEHQKEKNAYMLLENVINTI